MSEKKGSALLENPNYRPFNDESTTYLDELIEQQSASVEDEFAKYDTEDDAGAESGVTLGRKPSLESFKKSTKLELPKIQEPEKPTQKSIEAPVTKKTAQPDYSKPPKLSYADMENEEGEIIDFSVAQNYHQLMEMITREGKIKNQTGQVLPAETVINLIYKLTYQDLKNYQKEDWTNITLRHRLRETVAKLIYEYKKTDEFKALAGLDLSGATTIEEVLDLVDYQQKLIDAQGNYVTPEIIIDNIKTGKLHLLPEPIRFKVIEINKRRNEQEILARSEQLATKPRKSLVSSVGSIFSKLKFWGK